MLLLTQSSLLLTQFAMICWTSLLLTNPCASAVRQGVAALARQAVAALARQAVAALARQAVAALARQALLAYSAAHATRLKESRLTMGTRPRSLLISSSASMQYVTFWILSKPAGRTYTRYEQSYYRNPTSFILFI
ncbi:hypothetical protein DPMN_045989 [Dreissena polymorpha]|uniref:Secreted protein n=1 Tax=Dreissena polymorpha TaxID=45954 RepID=A0A9D4D5X8_DREPO|nr:hypothetical protein DPMN_045989 [Dreissena polymorpha]